MDPIFYIVPVVAVLLVCVIGYAASNKAAGRYRYQTVPVDAETADVIPIPTPSRNSGVYEKPDVDQHSNHSLGAVQELIRGRIRFAWFGLILVGVSLAGLWIFWRSGFPAWAERTHFYDQTDMGYPGVDRVIVTGLAAFGIICGLRIISFATYRVKLRRTGFEICSIFGTKTYEYNDVEFRLFDKWEHRTKGNGYRPVFSVTASYNRIWVWQIIFKDKRKTLEIKSSRYAWLYDKTRRMMDALYREN